MVFWYPEVLLVGGERFGVVAEQKMQVTQLYEGFGLNVEPKTALVVVVSIIRILPSPLLRIIFNLNLESLIKEYLQG